MSYNEGRNGPSRYFIGMFFTLLFDNILGVLLCNKNL